MVKNQPANAADTRDAGSVLGWGTPPEEEMATHASVLASEIPWTGEPGGLQSMGSHRVGHNLATEQQTHSQETAIIYMWVIILPGYVGIIFLK